ncbi:hypothetical protein CL654_01815 [bacterium]|nr:hypothetical protein [bacterium]|tara:strand:+ start:500 stop:1432 length:933 start_codon:yes stop_codon:yes gene_type:complete
MTESLPYSQAVFFIDTDKISPNPHQPRKEFNEEALQSLSDSIRQYGVLQPLVVTRKEITKDDGGIAVEYELVAGERRLRASRLAGLAQVPAVIRAKEDNDKVKLELAIIENLQREDLNPIDRAEAFAKLSDEFSLTHNEIAKKMGKSREYVSNSIRLLMLPGEMLQAVREGKINEGHTRPILMLSGRDEAQQTLFRDIIDRRLTVRDAEAIARKIAQDKVRKPTKIFDRETSELEDKLAERLGTRVRIEKKENGGKIMIEFFSPSDLDNILQVIEKEKEEQNQIKEERESPEPPKEKEEEDLYSISNFSV